MRTADVCGRNNIPAEVYRRSDKIGAVDSDYPADRSCRRTQIRNSWNIIAIDGCACDAKDKSVGIDAGICNINIVVARTDSRVGIIAIPAIVTIVKS